MTIRRKQRTSSKHGRTSNFSNRRKKVLRAMQMENLEERRMLFGPQLAGIQANGGALLEDGDQLDNAPVELRLRFDDNQIIDNATVANSIEITRSGFDNEFARATAETDFGTGGSVRMLFSAQQVGAGGNGVRLIFSASDQGNAGLPIVTSFGQVVTVNLNTNLGNESTAADLLSVLNNGPASSLLSAEISVGFAGEVIANSPLTYSPILLTGANQAGARNSFNIGSSLQIRFTATELGPAGNGVAVSVTKADLGPGTAPAVGVNGRTVAVTLNENAVGATTAGDLVSAINGNGAAASILTAAVEVGLATQVISGPPVTYSPIALGGANDVTVQPGFIGLGDSPNEVIVRFAETLPDDRYRIDIHGSGSTPLRNEAGELFNMGTDVTVNFDLDVAPLVRAIIPQPVHRDAGGNLFQQRDKIVVHFNDDDLLVENDGAGNPTQRSIEHPSFFQLILTQDTVENTDDVVFLPSSVAYDSANDVAILTFDGDLSALVDPATGDVVGAGTFRLRVGTNEEAFLAPNVVNIDANNDPGASFVNARELEIDGSWDTGAILEVIGTGADVIDGQFITLTNELLERTSLEFESGFVIGIEQTLSLTFPADGGNSVTDGDTIVINDGVQDVVFEFDEAVLNNGIGTGSISIPFAKTDDVDAIIDAVIASIQTTSLAVEPINLGGGLMHAGTRSNHTVDTSNSLVTQDGVIAPVSDGQTFTFDDGAQAFTFEFNDTGLPGTPLPGNEEIAFDASMTTAELADVIRDAIITAGVDLANPPTSLGDKVHVGGRLTQTLDTSGTLLTQFGAPGVRPAFGLRLPATTGVLDGLVDGDTFTITDGATTTVTFEFVDTAVGGSAAGGNVGINFTPTLALDAVADAVVTAIDAAGLGLTPSNLGDGRIELSGTFNHEMTLPVASPLQQEGSPGIPAAVAVPFLPDVSFNASQIAASIASALNGQPSIGIQGLVTAADNVQLVNDTKVELDDTITALKKSFQSAVISSAIDPQDFPLQLPGSDDSIAHRDIPVQSHLLMEGDTQDGVATIWYNFQDIYGQDPLGNDLRNAITPEQRQRSREIFEFYSSFLGIDFIESQDQGITVATGDIRAIDPTLPTGQGLPESASDDSRVVLDLQDFSRTDDDLGGPWFVTAMREIGRVLGLGPADELPPLTTQNLEAGALARTQIDEPVFPGDATIVHGQHLYRPDVLDVDLYKFVVHDRGTFTAETVAERLNTNETADSATQSSSTLDSLLSLYKENKDSAGNVESRELIARNDDYFSEDSFIELELEPGTYYIGVSASGNSQYNPSVDDSGFGGTSQGPYDLLLNFRPQADESIRDETGNSLDGDADSQDGGVFNFWFRSALPEGQGTAENTLFVDKSEGSGGDGSLATPFNNLPEAFTAAQDGDIVRVVGNPGVDNDLGSLADNRSYDIGFSRIGPELDDGVTLDVPKGVTLMVDSGAIFKLRRARIGVGSSSPNIDRSGGSMQVLGAPWVLDANGLPLRDINNAPIPGHVYFTSLHDKQIGQDANPDQFPSAPLAGDWGGIVFRGDNDSATNLENDGLFLNYVAYGDLRFGGGSVFVDNVSQVVSPLQFRNQRPTINYNLISNSADAAISGNPDAFRESRFSTPQFQQMPFTPDYDRVGPDLYGNRLQNNSINGLFVRVATPAGDALQPLTVSARWDDSDIVHVLAEHLAVSGTPGGPISLRPAVNAVSLNVLSNGNLAEGSYNYRLVFVTSTGEEAAASIPTETLAVGDLARIRLENLPPASTGFVNRRLYRSTDSGDGPYTLVREIGDVGDTFIDTGTTVGGVLLDDAPSLVARLDARLAIDPRTIVKLNGATIETQIGTQFLAEGTVGNEVVFTSILDDRYGAGGTFDTTNNLDTDSAAPGDWGGLFFGHLSHASIDHGRLTFAGGTTKVEGNFSTVNAIEIHQAQARITNSSIQSNAAGVDGQAPAGRFGRGNNGPSVIFVRGSQPVIANNIIQGNQDPLTADDSLLATAAISIDVNSLNSLVITDGGRSIGAIDSIDTFDGNQGPLIRGNRMVDNGLSGMVVRRGTLTTQGVFDDTDIAHIVLETITIPDFHVFGGLRIESSPTESLVVKLQGDDAGFTVFGKPLDYNDRIGGAIQVIGQPGHSVVFTSVLDNTVGAGFEPSGAPLLDTIRDQGLFANALPQITPFGPEIPNGTLIDNDVVAGQVGQFAFQVDAGGVSGYGFPANGAGGGITVQDPLGNITSNLDVIFEFYNIVDVGSDGTGLKLDQDTNVTLNPTLIGDDMVVSEGDFTGDNGTVNWRAETTMLDGVPIIFNKLIFTSGSPFGDLQFINYLDEDVFAPSDDLLFTRGTPGEDDFRAFTIDGANRYGFSQGGKATQGTTELFVEAGMPLYDFVLENATYDGWAADMYRDLLNDLEGTGTTYDPLGNIDTVDIPPFIDPSLGPAFGPQDVTTAFAWTLDSSATTATITTVLELVPTEPVENIAGDWRSLELREFTHDRNIEVVTEHEAPGLPGEGVNNTANTSQDLGALARDLKSGDDNLRLGFEIHGLLDRPSDVDVFRFDGTSGTEVWIDIDRTSQGLDTVVELIGSDGQILALSDNSFEESQDPSLLSDLQAASMAPGTVNPLQQSLFAQPDDYSTNQNDAGLRVALPGDANTTNTYHIRVRSSNLGPGDPRDRLVDRSEVNSGRSEGLYQLQIRLQETDEIPGSTIQFADIRFATNGIEINGLPSHSPLLGEAAETDSAALPNDTILNADDVGNILQSDAAVISAAGRLSSATDVDFFGFDVEYTDVEDIANSVTNTVQHSTLTFDLDYADGIGRANSRISLFDENGNLIYVGGDSNVGEDRPGPLSGANLDDLSHGTVGPLDPFIGPVAFPVAASGTVPSYFLGISSEGQIPADLEQFFTATTTDPNAAFVRLEPNNSLSRIAEDHIDQQGGSTARFPEVPVLVDTPTIVPFTLGDVVLMVSQDPGPNSTTNVYTVDPITGQIETTVGRFGRDVGDIALRHNGDLHAFSKDDESGAPSDGAAGNYLQIDTGTAAITGLNDDGVEVYNSDPANPGTQINSLLGGVHYEALSFVELAGVQRGYVVGNRFPANGISNQFVNNILYEFDPASGDVTSSPGADRSGANLLNGPGTNKLERGILKTDVDTTGTANTTIVAKEATEVDSNRNTTFNVTDGLRFGIGNGAGGVVNFEFNSGAEVTYDVDPENGVFVRDADSFALDGVTYEFNTGSVIVLTAVSGSDLADGDTITITDNQSPAVTRVFEFDTGNGISSNEAISFNFGNSPGEIVDLIVDAINATANFNVQAIPLPNSNRITLTQDSLSIGATVNSSGVEIEGDPDAAAGAVIRVEETFDNDEFGDAIANAISTNPVASVDGARINFAGTLTGDFTEIENRNVFVDQNSDGLVSFGHVGVNFLAADSAVEIAQRIVTAINTQAIPGVTASSNQNVVTISGDRVEFVDPPLQPGGSAPGGLVTGLAFIGSEMYAVSDRGGLFQVDDYDTVGGATANYIPTSASLLGIEFAGLTAGPPNVEGGRFADMLFGLDNTGRVYAFDTSGFLQPVFADGKTSVNTGIVDAHGLAFSNLDYNLWHVTENRDTNQGHGIAQPFDGSRSGTTGGSSLYFGFESQAANGISVDPVNAPGNSFDYDFPGGAHGSIESRTFSLVGHSAEDRPVLYFNYFAETEGAQAELGQGFMRDAFRVFISGDDGVWTLLATNNTFSGPDDLDDERDLGSSVQEVFDNTGDWRQVRVPLDAFAGQDNLQLRFDFSTAGSMNTGDPTGAFTTGDELRGVSGRILRDGDQVLIDNDVFEFDLGYSFVVPSGAAVNDGETFTVDSVKFEFDNPNGPSPGTAVDFIPIEFNTEQPPETIAFNIAQAIRLNQPVAEFLVGTMTNEANDTLLQAVSSGITGQSAQFVASGRIDDNSGLAFNPGLDVDMIQVTLEAGDSMEVDIDASSINSPLDALVRVFDVSGNQLAQDDNTDQFDPLLNFVAPADGVYYVGISNAENSAYDPSVVGSGTSTIGSLSAVGFYDVTVTVTDFLNVLPIQNRVNLVGVQTVTASSPSSVILEGTPGVSSGAAPIFANSGLDSIGVATAIRQSLAGFYAGGTVSAIRQYGEFVRILNHDITDPGPLGLTNSLPGDAFGSFFASTAFDGSTSATEPGALRAQQNAFEGIYIDDLIIGFAERGEMVTGATGSSSFVANPSVPANQILEGDYQVEVRRATETGGSSTPPATNSFVLTEAFDTNDRLTQGVTLVIPGAHEIIDGQEFTINDGINRVTFEFDDVSLLPSSPRAGVAQGNVRVTFDPAVDGSTPEANNVVAARVRDLINSPNVQSRLDVTSASVDGIESGPMSDNLLNLFGNASLEILASNTLTGDLFAETNDSSLDALRSGVTPAVPSTFTSSGTIGDNPNLIANNSPLDVDLVELNLVAGTRVLVDIDANEDGGNLDGVLRLFNLKGEELASSDNNAAPGEDSSLDPYIDFEVPKTDTYFVGVSTADNDAYDILIEGSGANAVGGGDYDLEIVVETGGIAFDTHDAFGDSNVDRIQGQLIIKNNRITTIEEAGIAIRAGFRTGAGELPHPGPVRNLQELNPARLVPGVTVTNNLIAGAGVAAISISGDAGGLDALGNPLIDAPIGFSRIINNTLVGGTIKDPPDSPPLVFNDVTFPLGQLSFVDNVRNYNPLLGGSAPATTHQQVRSIVGVPDYVDPGNGLTNPTQALSLGHGGQVIVEFRDNTLTGSGDSSDDLFIFEVGRPEGVAVDVSVDGVNFVSVGETTGGFEGIDIDSFGFTENDGFNYVRLTDLTTDGAAVGADVGADIDAIGALASTPPFIFRQGGIGIEVFDNASPTLLNNIVVNFETGLQIDLSSDSTVVGGTLYQHNLEDALTDASSTIGLGSFPIQLASAEPLFVQPAQGNFYLASGSRAIDSSVDSLQDRPALVTVKSPIGVGLSPILAPKTDLTGQARVDDPRVVPSPGVGANVFKDRGAIDRADFIGPTGVVHTPADNDGSADLNPTLNEVLTSGVSLPQFTIQLTDGVLPVDPIDGSGPDPNTVTGAAINVFKDNVLLLEGIDYRFEYDAANGFIRLTPIAGLWPINHEFKIELTNEDRIEIVAPAGDSIVDGDSFIIDDNDINNGSTTFEFDTGFLLSVPSGFGIADGEQFTIVASGFSAVFEFDNNGRFDPTSERIEFTSASTTDQITDAVITAIQNSVIPLTPLKVANGRIHLGGNVSDLILLAQAPSLALAGTPGTSGGATSISVIPVSSTDVAGAIADAINNSTSLAGTNARPQGNVVVVQGASLVQGLGDPPLIQGIRDIAGNPLKPNTVNGTTEFRILLGSGLDFGDAPASYGTLVVDQGARHTIVEGLKLGSEIDIDFDGQPNAAADGDDIAQEADEDGVTGLDTIFTAYPTSIDVNVSGDGILTGWIDYDGNGTFDFDEKIIDLVTVTPGTNPFTFLVPGAAQPGTSYARFRLSSLGTSEPIGAAGDGEVEDYAVTISNNPNTNPDNPLDVNGDGSVSPIDALLVINHLNQNGSGPLPLPSPPILPPFLDVFSDGSASPIDALTVINFLNNRARSGEGEGEDGPEGEFVGPGDLSQSITVSPQSIDSSADLIQARVANHSQKTDSSVNVEESQLPELVTANADGEIQRLTEEQGRVSFADIESTIDDLVEDDDELSIEQDAHDDFFANIHFG